MQFNKVPLRKWNKIIVDNQRVYQPLPPLAKIEKKNGTLNFNKAATILAISNGFQYSIVDLYQSGNEFAFSKGSAVCLNLHKDGTTTKKSAYGTVNSRAVCQKLIDATKTKVFSVRVEDGYLILSPIYDDDNTRQSV